jgi:hypothetical protein
MYNINDFILFQRSGRTSRPAGMPGLALGYDEGGAQYSSSQKPTTPRPKQVHVDAKFLNELITLCQVYPQTIYSLFRIQSFQHYK